RPGLGTAAVARLAFLHCRNADLHVAAARSVLEGQIQVVAKVGTAIDAVAARAPLLAEDFAEDVTEGVGETAEALGAARAGSAETSRCVDAGVAELVVGRALLRVRQDLVRFLGLLEAFLGALFRIAIRMVLHRELRFKEAKEAYEIL